MDSNNDVAISQWNQWEEAIKSFCGATGTESHPVCRAYAAGELQSEQPYSCMVDLINTYCNQGQELTEDQKKAAYDAFVKTTGLEPLSLTGIIDALNNQANITANFNSFYMFAPITILLVIFIWLLVIFQRINWVIGIFATVFVIVILYSFSIAYRISVQIYARNRKQALDNEAYNSEQNFQDSIAYWPQGLFAVACAITCTGNTGTTGATGCWTCNLDDICPDCEDPQNPVDVEEDQDEDQDEDLDPDDDFLLPIEE